MVNDTNKALLINCTRDEKRDFQNHYDIFWLSLSIMLNSNAQVCNMSSGKARAQIDSNRSRTGVRRCGWWKCASVQASSGFRASRFIAIDDDCESALVEEGLSATNLGFTPPNGSSLCGGADGRSTPITWNADAGGGEEQ